MTDVKHAFNQKFDVGIETLGMQAEAMMGQVFFRGNLDYESNTFYQYTVFATVGSP